MENNKSSKTSNVVCMIIWAIVALILIGILMTALFCGKDFFGALPIHINFGGYTYSDASSYSTGDGNTSEELSDIDVDWIGGSVKILPYDGSVTKIEEITSNHVEEEDLLRWKVENGRLIVKFCASRNMLNFSTEKLSKSLTIYVPESMLSTLDTCIIEAVSADVTIDSVGAKKLDVETVSGVVTVKHSNVMNAEIDTTSGEQILDITVSEKADIESISGKISFIGAASNFEIESVSGSVNMTLTAAANKIEATSVSGKITLLLPKGIFGFTASLDSVSGEVSSDFLLKKTGSHYVSGDGAMVISAETVSGDLVVNEAK